MVEYGRNAIVYVAHFAVFEGKIFEVSAAVYFCIVGADGNTQKKLCLWAAPQAKEHHAMQAGSVRNIQSIVEYL